MIRVFARYIPAVVISSRYIPYCYGKDVRTFLSPPRKALRSSHLFGPNMGRVAKNDRFVNCQLLRILLLLSGMKKRLTKYHILLGTVILLVIFGLWFWSLSALNRVEDPNVFLVVEKGTVFITSKDSGLEQRANSGLQLKEGDTLRTGQDSSASILVFGRADMRLDENTTLVIEQADWQGVSLNYKWRLTDGRVWSRVLRLLDLESSYQGQTDSVVATVRGTAYALLDKDNQSELLVDHGSVLIDSGSGNFGSDLKIDGDWVLFQPNGRILESGEVASSTWRDNAWRDLNKGYDTNFVESATRALLLTAGVQSGHKPDQWLYGLSVWSEKLRIWLTGKKAVALQARYAGRRVAYAHDLIVRGKSGLAFHVLSETEKEIIGGMEGERGAEYAEQIRPVVGGLLLAVSEVQPNDLLYRYKIRLEDLYMKVWEGEPAQLFYARALAIDTRLDEASAMSCGDQSLQALRETINAVMQGLAREENDFVALRTTLNPQYQNLLDEKIKSHGLRLDRLRRKLDECQKLSLPIKEEGDGLPAATSTESGMDGLERATSTQRNGLDGSFVNGLRDETPPVSEDNSRPPVVVQELDLEKISLSVQPSPVKVGESVSLKVTGYKRDGSSLDVTDLADFKLMGNLGSLSGTVYSSNAPGSVTIEAVINDGLNMLSSRVSVTVIQTVELSRISITPAGGDLAAGQSRTLSVTAYYSNGFSSNVTAATRWSLSNDFVSLAGSTITAGLDKTGVVTVTAEYSENGITKNSAVDFHVIYGQRAIGNFD